MSRKSQAKESLPEVSETYSKVKTKYHTLGTNLAQALELFLKDHDIKVLSVSYRIKDETSFVEKIDRKNYEKPFDEIEDICGLRIICYYQSDVEKIAEIISKEFEILENQDKEELLKADQFGYRSTHFIVKIKKNWLQAPNYRGLEDLKAEIQIRTVLMHAWAEIEHKLAYKKDTHIPKQFKRKLYRISAKLEEADEQFEELRNDITNYKDDVIEIAKGELADTKDIELNLDSLQAFLDTVFPDRVKSIGNTTSLIDDLLRFKIELKDFILSYELVKDYLPKIEKEFYELLQLPRERWAQAGIARVILALTNESFLNTKLAEHPYRDLFIRWSKIIQKAKAESK